MIYLDNIIFYLQKNGGISKYWHYLLRDIEKNKLKYKLINQKNISKNIFFKKKYQNFQNTYLPNSLNRYLPVNIHDNKKHIFHSSYYRLYIIDIH